LSDERTRRPEKQLIEDRLGVRARIYGTEQAILVGIAMEREDDEELLRELELLVDTAGIPSLATVVQNRKRPDPATYIGKGKVDELRGAAEELGADVLVFNNDLSPAQARNLEERLNRKVIDRTQLIMDIFAQRAATKEAKLQVELAQLRYLLPRLRGWGMALTRIGGGASGGIGTRGPGETQLELDRNKINRRIHALEKRIEKTREERAVRRKRRDRSALPQVALVGYTNSGKSTLLNRLCEEETFVEDRLFATLDTKVRRGEVAPGRVVLFADTVGFIRDLPHNLVPAFAATLEAARHCDLLLHVVDASKATLESDHRAVLRTLEEEVFHDTDERPPMLTVLNKIDLCIDGASSVVEGVAISAKSGANVEELLSKIEGAVLPEERTIEFSMPLTALHELHSLRTMGRADILRYVDSSAIVRARVTEAEWGGLQRVGASVVAACPDEEP